MKSIVIILLVAILVTLGSGLFYLSGNEQDSRKLQQSMRIRVILSAVLVVFLIVGYFLGWTDG